MKKKEVYFILGFILLITSILVINAFVDKDKAWHSADEILVTVDGFTMTLQEAITDNVFVDGATESQTTEVNPGHDADEIWVSVDGDEKTLQDALLMPNDLCGNSTTISYSAQSISKYQLANEIEVFINGSEMSIQDAIDKGDFCYTPYLWLAGFHREAFKYDLDGFYTGAHWDLASSETNIYNPGGITTDGNYFWVCEYHYLGNEVAKYNLNGTYTGERWDTSGSGMESRGGMDNNKTHAWIADYRTHKVYVWNMDGTYTGESWSTSYAPHGVTVYGEFIWVTDGNDVYKYGLDGTYTGESWSTPAGNANAIDTDGNYFWIADYFSYVYKYEMNGTYTGESWSLAESGYSSPRGITISYEKLNPPTIPSPLPMS